jgi:putative PIN family toxin of toxin-antitoxin system
VRLVLDTNVLFAAYISHGTCATLYEQALASETLVTSQAILAEFEEKLIEKVKLSASEAAVVRQQVAADAIVVEPITLPAPICRDADDDVILATAVAARADLIVTGDKDLLVLGSYEGIPIVTPGISLARIQT